MNHLDYYKYQATARGIRTVNDVSQSAHERAYVYDRLLLPWLSADKASEIGELACGQGSLLHWLRAHGYSNLTGVDSSAEQITLARQVHGKVLNEDVNRWLVRQTVGSFSTLIAVDLIEHLSKDDLMEFLRASRRALRRNGCLILRLPNGESPLVGLNLFNDITHVWTYTPNCLGSLAAMHGFSNVRFADEGAGVIRDFRWFKVPLAKLSTLVLSGLVRAVTRERIRYWSPHLWARLETPAD